MCLKNHFGCTVPWMFVCFFTKGTDIDEFYFWGGVGVGAGGCVVVVVCHISGVVCHLSYIRLTESENPLSC